MVPVKEHYRVYEIILILLLLDDVFHQQASPPAVAFRIACFIPALADIQASVTSRIRQITPEKDIFLAWRYGPLAATAAFNVVREFLPDLLYRHQKELTEP